MSQATRSVGSLPRSKSRAASHTAAAEKIGSTVVAGPQSHEAIASLAYQKWQSRGCPLGDDMKDWFEAEAELRQNKVGRGG
jgi:hypothetical protein